MADIWFDINNILHVGYSSSALCVQHRKHFFCDSHTNKNVCSKYFNYHKKKYMKAIVMTGMDTKSIQLLQHYSQVETKIPVVEIQRANNSANFNQFQFRLMQQQQLQYLHSIHFVGHSRNGYTHMLQWHNIPCTEAGNYSNFPRPRSDPDFFRSSFFVSHLSMLCDKVIVFMLISFGFVLFLFHIT